MDIELDKEFGDIVDNIAYNAKEETLDENRKCVGTYVEELITHEGVTYKVKMDIFFEKADWYRVSIEGENEFSHSEQRHF